MGKINKVLIIFIMLCFGITAEAQRPYFAKLSPLVREAWLSSRFSPTLSKSRTETSSAEKTITAFVKADNADAVSSCNILARYGSLYIAEIPINHIAQLSRDHSVQRIEAGRLAHTTMDTTRMIVGADALRAATVLPKSYTGRGVVVGVQDIGFDLTHSNFWGTYSGGRHYRIKALWDQLSTDTVGSRMPVGRDYRDSLSLLTLGCPRDGYTQTHGTHTAGIAAGSGMESYDETTTGLYSGIAPDADLCFVCNATSNDAALIDSADYYKYTYALDALGFKYIFDYADSVGKPCVINFSEGSQEDLRGDDKLYYEMLDSLTGPGHIIVASAGNEGTKLNYAHKPQGVDSLSVSPTSADKMLSVTARTNDNFTLRIKVYDRKTSSVILTRDYKLSDIISSKDSVLTDALDTFGTNYNIIATAYKDCYDATKTVCDFVMLSSDNFSKSRLTFGIIGNNADVEMFPVTATFQKTDGGFNLDNSHSILSPGSAPSVICVGSTSYRTHFINWQGDLKVYDHGTDGVRTLFSSVGPTWDGRVKPDVMAPGDNIISSYSSFYEEHNPKARDISSDVRHFTFNGRTYAWNSNAGTSMSAPVVTGVIALWLQANPKLTPEDCKNIIANSSTRYDESLDYPNNLYGYGQIDALGGMKYLLDKMSTGIEEIREENREKDIYSISGQYLGRDGRSLNKGIYIIGNNKVVLK